VLAVPTGYKIVISRALGMHGIYCTQPSAGVAQVYLKWWGLRHIKKVAHLSVRRKFWMCHTHFWKLKDTIIQYTHNILIYIISNTFSKIKCFFSFRVTLNELFHSSFEVNRSLFMYVYHHEIVQSVLGHCSSEKGLNKS
jgi:hypothetical protein